jgi:hypothetical protein
MRKGIFAAIALCIIGVFMLTGGKDAMVEREMQKAQNKVAADAEEQYNIALRQGDKSMIYLQAGFVSAAYLQSKDEANYIKWKEIEKQAAIDAGIK